MLRPVASPPQESAHLAAQLDGQAFAWEQAKQAEVAAALALEDEGAAKAAVIAVNEVL